MALYVIRVPNPGAGNEWLYEVPGQYLEVITGVTATLASQTGDPATAVDSSGSGNDLAYQPDLTFGVPGYVTTDFMVRNAHVGSSFTAEGIVDMTDLTGNDLFFNVWSNRTLPVGTGPGFVSFAGATSSMVFHRFETFPPGTSALTLEWRNTGGATTGAITATGVIAAGRHMYSVRLDLAGVGGQFYVDGVPFGGFVAATGTLPNLETSGTLRIGGGGTLLGSPFYDEIAVGANPTVDADFAALYAARGVFATYTGAQLAMGPSFYYHLDEVGVGIDRQVLLEITNGSDTVEAIPTGFPTTGATGPFFYSWQPKLAAKAQTMDATTTTVPVPELVLPAGYTIGSRTLDLGAADQWSDVAIWWDSSLMDAIYGPGAYDFPPAVRLVYHQDPNAPIIDF